MDNRDLLTLLKENAKTKEEVLLEQEAEDLRKQQEEKLKQQQNIRAFDQFLCDKFKEVLVEAVGKGLAENINGKRVVEGAISFEYQNLERADGDSESYNHVTVKFKGWWATIIEGMYHSKTEHGVGHRKTLIPNCDCSILGYRNLFRVYKTTENTHKTFWGKTKPKFIQKLYDDDDELTSFINFFNSELTGVARIINHEFKQYKTAPHLSRDYTYTTSRNFFFIAEF